VVTSVAAEKFRLDLLLRDGMAGLAVGRFIDEHVHHVLAALLLRAGEEGDHAVVVVLGPAVEGMVVTLGALDACAEEELRHVFHQQLRVALAVEIGLGIFNPGAFRGDEAMDDFVHRRLVFDLLMQPRGVAHGGFLMRSGGGDDAAGLEPLAPFHGPEVGELRPREQAVHEARAFVTARVVFKLFVFREAGQQADGVDEDAAHEVVVAAHFGGCHAKLREAGIDGFVDEIPTLRERGGRLLAGHDIHAHAADEGGQAHGDEDLAAPMTADEALTRDTGDGVVGAFQNAEVRDIALRAIGEAAHDDEAMALPSGIEREVGGIHAHAAEVRFVGGAFRCASGNPIAQQGEVRIVRRELFPTAMRHRARAFFQQQTVLRQSDIDAAIHKLTREAEVVGIRVITEEREPKAILASRGTVAATGATAIAHQHRHDVVLKRGRSGLRTAPDLHLRRRTESRVRHHKPRAARGLRRECARSPLGEAGIFQSHLRLSCNIAGQATLIGERDHHTLAGGERMNVDVLGENLQRGR
jgi:hypothetical protein